VHPLGVGDKNMYTF